VRAAFPLYKKAALLGDREAQCNLAIAYLEGLGTKPNLPIGIKWMERAARKSDPKAQYNLGLAYLEGEGVAENLSRARHWLKKAAANGHKRASARLKRLRLRSSSK
jgi:uncharacterized protein